MKISIRTGIILAGLFFLFAESHAGISKRPLLASLRSVILSTAEGKADSLSSITLHKATVFIFISSECPISNSYMPLLSGLASEFGKNNIAFYGVIADPDVTPDEAKKFAAEYHFPSDILMDRKQELASLLKAHITPEVFVVSSEGKIEYHGRIDDRFVALGKGRAKARHNDLRDALANITDGKKVKNPLTKVIGCWIPKAGK